MVIGTDWLVRREAEILCHEKVVHIPLENGGVLRVQVEGMQK